MALPNRNSKYEQLLVLCPGATPPLPPQGLQAPRGDASLLPSPLLPTARSAPPGVSPENADARVFSEETRRIQGGQARSVYGRPTDALPGAWGRALPGAVKMRQAMRPHSWLCHGMHLAAVFVPFVLCFFRDRDSAHLETLRLGSSCSFATSQPLTSLVCMLHEGPTKSLSVRNMMQTCHADKAMRRSTICVEAKKYI